MRTHLPDNVNGNIEFDDLAALGALFNKLLPD